MVRVNEPLFTNVKVTSFESSRCHLLFPRTNLTIIYMLIAGMLSFCRSRNIYVIGRRYVGVAHRVYWAYSTQKHVTRSVQLRIKCRRMSPVYTLFAIIYKYSRYNRAKRRALNEKILKLHANTSQLFLKFLSIVLSL